MLRTTLIAATLALLAAAPAFAQQRPDPDADLSVAAPAFPKGEGPRVAIDGGHTNFHTFAGGYGPFAGVLANDGFRVGGIDAPLTAESLAPLKVLVIANPLNAVNGNGNWALPTPSAYTPEEIAAVKAWVEGGGSLLLIADHMPFAGAAHDLAAAFGVTFENAFAIEGQAPERFNRANRRMHDDVLTAHVDHVLSFTGSTFTAPGATSVLTLDDGFRIITPQVAWQFDGQPTRPATTSDLRLARLTVGRGRIVVGGEAAMFTAQIAGPQGQVRMGLNAPGAEQNKTLLLNVMHWLAAAS